MHTPTRFRTALFGFTLASLSSVSHGALPTPQFDTAALSSVSFSTGCNQGQSTALGASSLCSTPGALGGGIATSGASASAARLSAYATADVFTPSINLASINGTGQASAHLSDYIQFSGAPNTQAVLSGAIVVHGGLTGVAGGSDLANSSTNASYAALGAFFGQSLNQSGSLHTSADGTYNANHINGTTVPVNVILNFDANGLSQVGSFNMTLSTYADGFARGFAGTSGVPGSASSAALFGETAYWGGVSSITDLNGSPVLGVTAVSSSGFNYMTSAVPEPTTAMLMGVGMLGLGALGRRRQT